MGIALLLAVLGVLVLILLFSLLARRMLGK